MHHKSLDVNLTVDKNLTLKLFHHCLTKFYKNLNNLSIVECTSNSL
jgi:hypothetical protein